MGQKTAHFQFTVDATVQAKIKRFSPNVLIVNENKDSNVVLMQLLSILYKLAQSYTNKNITSNSFS